MGNCECLRAEAEKSELNIQFKEKDYYNDYDSNPNNKAKGGNRNPFNMLNDDEDVEDNDKNKKIKINAKLSEYEDQNNNKVKIEEYVVKEIEVNKDIDKENNDDLLINVENIQDSNFEVIEKKVLAKPNHYSNIVEDTKPQIISPKKSEAKNKVLEAVEAFDSSKYSKNFFNLLNSVKVNPKLLQDKLERFLIPKESTAGEYSKKSILEFVSNKIPVNYKGKSFFWNEKGYNLLRSVYQRKVNGEEVNENFESEFLNKANAVIVHKFIIKGSYDVEDALLVFLLENSDKLNNILLNSSPLVSICSVIGQLTGDILTSIVFAKKK